MVVCSTKPTSFFMFNYIGCISFIKVLSSLFLVIVYYFVVAANKMHLNPPFSQCLIFQDIPIFSINQGKFSLVIYKFRNCRLQIRVSGSLKLCHVIAQFSGCIKGNSKKQCLIGFSCGRIN